MSLVYLLALYLVLLQLQTSFADDRQFYCLGLITGDMTFLASCVTLNKFALPRKGLFLQGVTWNRICLRETLTPLFAIVVLHANSADLSQWNQWRLVLVES